MPKPITNILIVLLFFGLTACTTLSRHEGKEGVGIDGVPCVGEIDKLPANMEETLEPILLQQAQAASEKGGICAGKVFTVQGEMRVYRIWDDSKNHTRFGRWWSLTRPQGSREEYRREYAICPSWSGLNRLTSCDIKAGTTVVIGTTQSAACKDTIYPKTSRNQIFIANNAAENRLLVENCRDEGVWP